MKEVAVRQVLAVGPGAGEDLLADGTLSFVSHLSLQRAKKIRATIRNSSRWLGRDCEGLVWIKAALK